MKTTISRVVVAKTHPSKYLLHKYWSRKPHNVISYFLKGLLGDQSIVVDPFCGSGVILHEAAKLGHTSYGFDINPVAVLISNVTCSPPCSDIFSSTVEKILEGLKEEFSYLYTLNGKIVRYAVHEIVAKCPKCGNLSTRSEANGGKRCIVCDSRMRFNMEYLTNTRVIGVMVDRQYHTDNLICEEQKRMSNLRDRCEVDSFNFSFAENRRILAFNGMKTADLFTPRNFIILTELANRFHAIEDLKIKNAALALLTASVAQCSRLIPFRNNMTTGGPAWSIPGFWVPAIHLETNPIIHLFARLKKFKHGIKELEKESKGAKVRINNSLAWEGIADLKKQDVRADLVFLDPPYGDSVPYLEFSAVWNSFLGSLPEYSNDISVSNRLPAHISWNKYNEGLSKTIKEVNSIIKDDGKILITFNNHNLQAWEALLSSLQAHNFICDFVTYQIPAVVSSKAQFSIEGSYLGDIYAVYSKANNEFLPSNSLDQVISALKICASSRGGLLAKNLALRTISIAWMENNISARLLSEREWIIKNYFDDRGGQIKWKHELDLSIEMIEDVIKEVAIQYLGGGPSDFSELYLKVAEKLTGVGLPDPAEVRGALEGIVSFSNGKCWLKEKKHQAQLSMF